VSGLLRNLGDEDSAELSGNQNPLAAWIAMGSFGGSPGIEAGP